MKVCNVCGYVAEEDDFSETCVICKKCDWSSSWEERDLKQISRDEVFIAAMMKLKAEDPIEYQLKMSQFKATITQQQTTEEKNVKCPKCGSTNIQIVPRKWSLLTGFLTNKTDRVCVNCKHKF